MELKPGTSIVGVRATVASADDLVAFSFDVDTRDASSWAISSNTATGNALAVSRLYQSDLVRALARPNPGASAPRVDVAVSGFSMVDFGQGVVGIALPGPAPAPHPLHVVLHVYTSDGLERVTFPFQWCDGALQGPAELDGIKNLTKVGRAWCKDHGGKSSRLAATLSESPDQVQLYDADSHVYRHDRLQLVPSAPGGERTAAFRVTTTGNFVAVFRRRGLAPHISHTFRVLTKDPEMRKRARKPSSGAAAAGAAAGRGGAATGDDDGDDDNEESNEEPSPNVGTMATLGEDSSAPPAGATASGSGGGSSSSSSGLRLLAASAATNSTSTASSGLGGDSSASTTTSPRFGGSMPSLASITPGSLGRGLSPMPSMHLPAGPPPPMGFAYPPPPPPP